MSVLRVKPSRELNGCDGRPGRAGEESAADVRDGASPADYTGRWWVLHTKSRQEKALAWDLRLLGSDYFLPVIRSKRRHGGRLVDVDIPLFPGYVFLCGDEEDRYRALMTHRVARVLDVVDQERLCTELCQIELAVRSNEPVNLYPGLRHGRRCRVVRGSLQGLEGVVLRLRSPSKLYLEVGILGQSAVVEIDASLLEAID